MVGIFIIFAVYYKKCIMKKEIILLSLFILLLAAWTNLAIAQAPSRITYQAVVRDAVNSIVGNHNVTLQLSLLQGSVTGEPVYVENHQAMTNSNGLVTVEMGAGTVVSGSMDNIDWSDGPYYLQSEIDPDGGSNYTIQGAQQLLSVPYALYANEAANGFSGNYHDLSNKPDIPTSTSELQNDAQFVSNALCDSVDICQLSSQMQQLWNLIVAQQEQIDSLNATVQMLEAMVNPTPALNPVTIQDLTGAFTCTLSSNDTILLINDTVSLSALCSNFPELNLTDSSLLIVTGHSYSGVQSITHTYTVDSNQHGHLTLQIMPSPIAHPESWIRYYLIPKITSLNQLEVTITYL